MRLIGKGLKIRSGNPPIILGLNRAAYNETGINHPVPVPGIECRSWRCMHSDNVVVRALPAGADIVVILVVECIERIDYALHSGIGGGP